MQEAYKNYSQADPDLNATQGGIQSFQTSTDNRIQETLKKYKNSLTNSPMKVRSADFFASYT